MSFTNRLSGLLQKYMAMHTKPLKKHYRFSFSLQMLPIPFVPCSSPDEVLGPLKIEPSLLALLLENINRRMTPAPVKLRALIAV
jgi:hypothetical protein